MDIALAAVTVASAIVALLQYRRRVRAMQAALPAWRTPTRQVRDLFRREPRRTNAPAQPATSQVISVDARGLVGKENTLDFRVDVLEDRIKATDEHVVLVEEHVKKLDVRLTANIDAGDRQTLSVLAPDITDLIVVVLLAAAAGLTVVAAAG